MRRDTESCLFLGYAPSPPGAPKHCLLFGQKALPEKSGHTAKHGQLKANDETKHNLTSKNEPNMPFDPKKGSVSGLQAFSCGCLVARRVHGMRSRADTERLEGRPASGVRDPTGADKSAARGWQFGGWVHFPRRHGTCGRAPGRSVSS